jgi:hypothetical protein
MRTLLLFAPDARVSTFGKSFRAGLSNFMTQALLKTPVVATTMLI